MVRFVGSRCTIVVQSLSLKQSLNYGYGVETESVCVYVCACVRAFHLNITNCRHMAPLFVHPRLYRH